MNDGVMGDKKSSFMNEKIKFLFYGELINHPSPPTLTLLN